MSGSRSLGRLTLDLIAKIGGFESGMSKAERVAQDRAKGIDRAFSSLGATITKTFALIGGSAAVIGAAKNAIELGDSLNKAAIKAGIGGKAISELAHAAKMSDVDLNSLSTSIKKMQVNLSEAATGGKAQIETLRALGLELKDIKGLAADRQFELIADRIYQLKDPADKARAATDLFGKAGENLLPMFEDGARGIRLAREEAEALGKSLDDVRMNNLSEADKALKTFAASWEATKTNFFADIVPSLTKFLNRYNAATWDSAKLAQKLKELQEGSFAWMHAEEIAKMQKLLENAKRREAEAIFGPGGQPAAPPSGSALGFGAADAAAKAAEEAEKLRLLALQEENAEIMRGNQLLSDRALETLRFIEDSDRSTQTAWQRQEQQIVEFGEQLQALRTAGIIDWDESTRRLDEFFDNLRGELEEVETINKPGFFQEIFKAPDLSWIEGARIALDDYVMAASNAALLSMDVVGRAVHGLEDTWANFITTGKFKFKDLANSIIADLAKIASQKLFANIFGSLLGGGGGGGWLGGLLGARASGGPVTAGAPYIIGEKGPELFVPNASGYVVPNHAMFSAGGSAVQARSPNVTINNYGRAKDFDVDITRDEIRIIATDVARKEAPSVVADQLQNPNSRVSKSLSQNTTASRMRK